MAFERRLYDSPGYVVIPFRYIFVIFFYITAALISGYYIRCKLTKVYDKFWSYQPPLTVFTLVFMLAVDIYKCNFIFELLTVNAFFLGAMLAAGGYIFGCALAFIFRLPVKYLIVMTIEGGSRTMLVTSFLLLKSLPEPENDISKATPLIAEVTSLVPCLVTVLVFRTVRAAQLKKRPNTESSFLDSTDKLECLDMVDNVPEMTEAKETTM